MTAPVQPRRDPAGGPVVYGGSSAVRPRAGMPTVLHFKTKYLNLSELFIDRLVRHHERYTPVIGTAEPRLYTDDLPVYTPTGLGRLLTTVAVHLNQTPPFLYDVVRRHQPAVIHGHFGLDSYRLIGLARRTQTPLLVNFYGYDVIRLPREAGWGRRYRKLAAAGAAFVAVSEAMRQDLIALGFPADRIEVVHLGLNPDRIRFQPRMQAGRRLMAIGRLVEKKGFTYALDAVRLLRERGVEVHLDLYGDGPLRDALTAQVEAARLHDAVTLHGKTPNDAVIAAFYAHDLLLVPSVLAADGDKEGLPQTLVEGMASGIPIVATAHAGIPELVRDRETGLLVPERDPRALADAVQTYLETPTLAAAVSRAGRRAVETQHDIRTLIKQTEALYDRIARPR